MPSHVTNILPEPFKLHTTLKELDREILGLKHAKEMGYSSYAVMQVASRLISDDLESLVNELRELVGEVDFSFTVNGSQDDVTSVGGKGKRD